MAYKRGFTLIELLVVISIIGLLSSIALASLNSARIKARDARRISDIRQIDTAIQLYIQANGHAPYLGEDCSYNSPLSNLCGASSHNPTWNLLAADLQPYIRSLPVDPTNSLYNPSSPTDYENMLYYQYVAPASLSNACDYPTWPIDSPHCAAVYGKNDLYGLYAAYESRGGYHINDIQFNGTYQIIFSPSTPRGFVANIGSHL